MVWSISANQAAAPTTCRSGQSGQGTKHAVPREASFFLVTLMREFEYFLKFSRERRNSSGGSSRKMGRGLGHQAWREHKGAGVRSPRALWASSPDGFGSPEERFLVERALRMQSHFAGAERPGHTAAVASCSCLCALSRADFLQNHVPEPPAALA